MTEITKEMISEEKSVNNTLNQENMEDQNNIEKNSESNTTIANNLNYNDMKNITTTSTPCNITLKDMIQNYNLSIKISTSYQALQDAETKLAQCNGVKDKTAQKKVRKAQNDLKAELQKTLLPTPIEEWVYKKEENGNYSVEVISKMVMIAAAPSLVNLTAKDKLAMDVVNDGLLEKDDPKHFCKAKLFYSEGIELIDLNGNPIPKDTPDVLVMIGSLKEQRIIKAIHAQNLSSIAKGDEQETITNVVIKEFTSVKECARYMGVNNLLDRTMKASEKVTLASKQNEVIEEIAKTSENEEVSINTVIKTCSGGYTITTGQWNDLVRGKQIELPEIDLETGKEIISRLKELCNKEKKRMNKFCNIFYQISNIKFEETLSLDERLQTTLNILGKLSSTDLTDESETGDIKTLVETAWEEITNPARQE